MRGKRKLGWRGSGSWRHEGGVMSEVGQSYWLAIVYFTSWSKVFLLGG